MRPFQFSLLLVPVIWGAVSCSDKGAPPTAPPKVSAAEVVVRRMELDLGGGRHDSVAFEVTCQKAGRLSLELTDVISTEATVAAGDRLVLRVMQRRIDGKSLLRDMVKPMFGADSVAAIEAQVPDAAERRAREIRMIVSQDGSSTTQSLLYKLPTGSVVSLSGARDSETEMSGEDKAELAHWAFMPRGFTRSMSIKRDPGADPVLHVDGAPVAADYPGKAIFLFLHWKPQ